MAEGFRTSLFIGTEITEKLQSALDGCEPYNERFFRHNDPEYLQMTVSSGKNVIGKRVASEMNISEIDNVVKNVMSILKKICSEYYFDQDEFFVFSEIAIG